MFQDRTETQKKQALQITSAFVYLSSPFTKPINHRQLEDSLTKIESVINHPQVLNQATQIMTQRYYQIINSVDHFQLQQYLLIKIIQLLGRMLNAQKQSDDQMIIVSLWGSVSHLKKCVPENKFKLLILCQLGLIQICIEKLAKMKHFKMQSIYPQISAVLMHFVVDSHLINHPIFQKSLQIMGKVLQTIFQNNHSLKSLSSNFMNILKNSQKETEKSFSEQCINRLQSYIKLLAIKAPALELIYQNSIMKFIDKIWFLGLRYPKMLCPLAILGEIVGITQKYDGLSSSQIKLIKYSITNEFLLLLQNTNSNMAQRTNDLKRLQKMASSLAPNSEQCEQIVKKFLKNLYLIYNNRSLIIPHSSMGQSTYLVDLTKDHSFSNYTVGISSLIQSFDFQCQRILLAKMPYAETSLGNIIILKKILFELPSNVSNMVLQVLLEKISAEDDQYMIDMSLTKFCQFITKILLIYWILKKPGFKPSAGLALNLFQTLNGSQAIRILQPSFEEQEMLIGFTLLICYFCYLSFASTDHKIQNQDQSLNGNNQSTQKYGPQFPKLSQVKKLKLRICLLQMTINNAYQHSFIIKSAAYYILLTLAAPQTVGQLLKNLQTTLINKNINNVQFVISLLYFCELTGPECQDLVSKFIQKKNSEKLFKIILPKLSTETIRKCLLYASNQKGSWIHMISGNTKLLYNKTIEQSQQTEEKTENFYMNDGPNVKVSNALGVTLLQLGEKWEYVLHPNSPFKEPALDLLIQIINLDPNMVFFKIRFIGILKCFYSIISQVQHEKQAENRINDRLCKKIYKILAKIPEINYMNFSKKIREQVLQNQNQPKIQIKSKIKNEMAIEKNILQQILQFTKRKHKKYQLDYLMNSTNPQITQIYDNSDAIIAKIANSLSMNQNEQQKQQQIDMISNVKEKEMHFQ